MACSCFFSLISLSKKLQAAWKRLKVQVNVSVNVSLLWMNTNWLRCALTFWFIPFLLYFVIFHKPKTLTWKCQTLLSQFNTPGAEVVFDSHANITFLWQQTATVEALGEVHFGFVPRFLSINCTEPNVFVYAHLDVKIQLHSWLMMVLIKYLLKSQKLLVDAVSQHQIWSVKRKQCLSRNNHLSSLLAHLARC